jgi:hypothetical protein
MTNAMTWLGRQIAWEARLAELRHEPQTEGADEVAAAA